MKYIKNDTIDVVEPVYNQTAVSRDANDIGYSYLEIDTSNKEAVMYVDGNPVIEAAIKLNGSIEPGCYKVKSKNSATNDGMTNVISFGNTSLYEYDENTGESGFSGDGDISGFSESTIKEGCMTADASSMNTIFNTMQEEWPVIIYNQDNIS